MMSRAQVGRIFGATTSKGDHMIYGIRARSPADVADVRRLEDLAVAFLSGASTESAH